MIYDDYMLTAEETAQLIELLKKADPRSDTAGKYTIIVTPRIFRSEVSEYRKVCINEISNVVGSTEIT